MRSSDLDYIYDCFESAKIYIDHVANDVVENTRRINQLDAELKRLKQKNRKEK